MLPWAMMVAGRAKYGTGSEAFTGKVSDNDLRLLRTFATVVKHGGFVAAESELQIGLPSISRYIKDLEIRLGARLCERRPARLHPDHRGRASARGLRACSVSWTCSRPGCATSTPSPADALRVGMVDALVGDPNFRLPEVFDRYKAAYPNVHFNIETTTSNLIEQAVIEEQSRRRRGVRASADGTTALPLPLRGGQLPLLHRRPPGRRLRQHDDRVCVDDIASYDFVGYPFEHEMERLGVRGLLKRTATVTTWSRSL
ncbi:LysR family transcriptional regulator [Caulobacter segnis]